eukprot:TRINITY_DN6348_c0_g1_i1.p1 TRINITY_DN6348_c0_g1~~TRINITY_DN6348_c0_g1_i1.p1  ORF type:complete len:434 (-),score=122.28 TRINITY_DN6348_c0_g1_i1:18-1160(-)
MDDKYFDDLFGEEREPFSCFISRLDMYSVSPFQRQESQPEYESLIDKAEFEDFRLQPPTSESHGHRAWEEMKEESLPLNGQNNYLCENLSSTISGGAKITSMPTIAEPPDESESKKEARAQRNKRYAKESRERKKKYVENLEQQVIYLKHELAIYKAKLKNYELIEKFKNTLGYEYFDVLTKVYNGMREANKSPNNRKYFAKEMSKIFYQILNEQIDALKMTTKMMADICLPAPMRVAMWVTDKKVFMMEAEEIAELMSPVLSLEQIKVVLEHDKLADPDGTKRKEFATTVTRAGKNIKEEIKKIIQCQKEIIKESKIMTEFMSNNAIVCYSPYAIDIHARIDLHLATKPEVRECGINNLLKNLNPVSYTHLTLPTNREV